MKSNLTKKFLMGALDTVLSRGRRLNLLLVNRSALETIQSWGMSPCGVRVWVNHHEVDDVLYFIDPAGRQDRFNYSKDCPCGIPVGDCEYHR